MTVHFDIDFPWGWLAFYGLLLFAFLYQVLTRDDFDAPNKVLWVLVLILVPVLGFVLYAVAAPKQPARSFSRTMIPGSDTAGTPWADHPGYTKRS